MLPPNAAWIAAEEVRIRLSKHAPPYDPDMEITCENCGINDKCEWAWDDYNTNGDCLAIK